jgi:integrase
MTYGTRTRRACWSGTSTRRVVSEALGHASVGITLDLYSHVQESMSRTAADAIEEVFGGSAT